MASERFTLSTQGGRRRSETSDAGVDAGARVLFDELAILPARLAAGDAAATVQSADTLNDTTSATAPDRHTLSAVCAPVRRQSEYPGENPVVLDELPQTVPISVRELEVIETYLCQLVDEVLAAKTEHPNPSCAMPLRGRSPRS